MSSIAVEYDDADEVLIMSNLKLEGTTLRLKYEEGLHLHKILGDALKQCKRLIADANNASSHL